MMQRTTSFLAIFFAMGLLGNATPLWADDCNQNGVDDAADIASGQSVDCNQNLIPDECDVAPSVAFSGAKIFPIGTEQPHTLAIADFDGDAFPDLATANEGGNNISVLFNDGNGRFVDGFNVAAAAQCLAVAAGDWDGDGRPDLVAGTADGVLPLSQVAGTFHAQTSNSFRRESTLDGFLPRRKRFI